jgi:AbrB family looped-hinge helix DNA binding protein
MSGVETTKMSSKGQVVIPEKIRQQLGLEPGAQFVVVGEGDVVILKRLSRPDIEDLEDLLAEARAAARRSGMKRSDIAEAIAAVREGR